MSNRVRTIIVIIVTAVWALNFVATLIVTEYQAPPEINSIFMATVGAALATAPIVGSRRQREEENGGEEEPRPNPDNGERQT